MFFLSVALLVGACCLDIRNFGADEKCSAAENAAAIQRTVDACAAKGGGRVLVPSGTYRTGTIELRSHVDLHLAEGAVLKASDAMSDFNAEDVFPENWGSRKERWTGGHLIFGYRTEGASITGKGVIDGNGSRYFNHDKPQFVGETCWREGHYNTPDKGKMRPGQLVAFVFGSDLKIDGITIRDAPSWTTYIAAMDRVKVINYTVRNDRRHANTDGLDIECCRDVEIRNADIDTGDDGIAIRAAQRHTGATNACERIRIAKCRLRAQAMGIRFGVGGGEIRDVIVEDVDVLDAGWAVAFQSYFGKASGQGVDMSDIRIRRLTANDGCYGSWMARSGGDLQRYGIRGVVFEDCVFKAPHREQIESDGRFPVDVRAMTSGTINSARPLLAHALSDGLDTFDIEKEHVTVSNGVLRVISSKKLTYASYPGAQPIAGPRQVVVKFNPSTPVWRDETLPCKIVLQLRKIGVRETRKFESVCPASAAEGGVYSATIDTNLSADENWQFVSLRFIPQKKGVPVDVTVSELTAVYDESKAAALDFDVETGDPVRAVFSDDVRAGCAKAVFVLRNRATTGRTRASAQVEMRDFFANAAEHRFAVDVESGGVAHIPFEVPSGNKGVWKVTAKITADDGSSVERRARFVVLDRTAAGPRLASGKFRIGVNYHIERFVRTREILENSLHAFELLGAKLARFDYTFGSVMREGPDRPNWSVLDRLVTYLKEHGSGMDVILWSCPKWARETERMTPEQKAHKYSYLIPGKRGTFRDYCEALAKRYGTDIDYYEMGNEPDLRPALVFDAATYAERIYLEGYEGVKAGCPAAKVIPGGFTVAGLDGDRNAGRSRGQRNFIGEFVRRAGERIDFLPFHQHGSYVACRRDVAMRLLPYLAKNGCKAQWYMNEAGLSSVRGNESAAARMVWRKILWCWANGSRDYIWYNLRATGWNPTDGEMGYGLVTVDFNPRDGFAAFAALTHLVSGLDLGEKLYEDDRRFAASFTGVRDGRRRRVIAGWDDASAEPVKIPFRTDASVVTAVDMMGNAKELPLADGRGMWEISELPSALVVEGDHALVVDRKDLADFSSAVEPVITPNEGNGWIPPEFNLCRHEQVSEIFNGLPQFRHRLWQGTNDLSATVWLHPWKDALRLVVSVRDDKHVQKFSGPQIFKGDSVMAGLRIPLTGKNWEFGFARLENGQPQVVVWKAPDGISADAAAERIPLKVSRNGTLTRYEAYLPVGLFGVDRNVRKSGFRFNLLVNDDDGEGVDDWIEVKPGIHGDKNFLRYPLIRL